MQRGELFKNVLIDGVVPFRERRGRDLVLERQRHHHHLHLTLEMHADRGLAHAPAFDDARGRHARDGLVIRVKLREPGHVAHASVGVMRAHEQALAVADPQRAIAGQHFETGRVGFRRARAGRARADPIRQRVVIARLRREAFAALVRHPRERLEQQEARVRRGGINAATAGFAGERLVIPVGRKPAQRELEAILPRELPVTAAGIAARAGEQGNNLLPERRHRARAVTRAARDHRHRFQAAEARHDFRRSRGHRAADAVRRDRDFLRLAAGELRARGHVEHAAIRAHRRDEQAVLFAWIGEREGGRLHEEADRGGSRRQESGGRRQERGGRGFGGANGRSEERENGDECGEKITRREGGRRAVEVPRFRCVRHGAKLDVGDGHFRPRAGAENDSPAASEIQNHAPSAVGPRCAWP